MPRETRSFAGLSRRTLVAAGAGWVLGAGGLFLPGTMDEVEAREGALGGAKGGRHGKNHRGRDKHRGKGENDKDREPQEEGLFSKGVSLAFKNQGSDSFTVSVMFDNGGSSSRVADPGFYDTLYADSGSVTIQLAAAAWGATGWLQIDAVNPAIGAPYVKMGPPERCGYYECSSTQSQSLSEGEGFDYVWNWGAPGQSDTFRADRLSDSSDYKLFLITALP